METEIDITSLYPKYVEGPYGFYDSVYVEISYRLVHNEDKFVKISLQKKDNTNSPFYKLVEGAKGDIGNEITAGENKKIQLTCENRLPFEFKLIANSSPEVEVITELVNQIDSTRMKEDLLLIEGIRHRNTGEANLIATQELIKERFSQYGFSIIDEKFLHNLYEGTNLIGTQEGCGKDENVWLIGGHYDTVDDSPGADDNGSAIVGMLEAARVLSQFQFEKRIAFVAWDLEEEGLLGSSDFVARNKDSFGKFEGYLNFEMIGYYSDKINSQTLPVGFDQLFPSQEQAIADDGYRGNFITNVGNTQNSLALMMAYEGAANSYVPDLKVISVAAPGVGAVVPDLQRSDHTPFWQADIPALMLTDGANFRNENYHGPNDVADSLNYTFMANVVKASVATIATDAIPTICHYDSVYLPILLDTEEVFDSNSLKTSPNPTNDYLTLALDDGNFSSDDSVIIINSNGAIVRREKLNKSQILKVEDLAAGLYHLVLRTKTRSYTTSFIIQR